MADEQKTLRQYLRAGDITTLVGITKQQISLAEALIDQYVRFTCKDITLQYAGVATSGTTTKIIDTSPDTKLDFLANYFKYTIVEIVAGANEGEVRAIISSNQSE